jgi:TolA-binding protein
MDKFALLLSIAALALASVSYWRSGGQQDIAAIRQELESEIQTVRTKQKELADNLTTTLTSTYDDLRNSVDRSGERLAELRKDATETLRKQIDQATRQMEELQGRIANGLKAVKDSTLEKARETEHGLAKRVHWLEARVDILEAKVEVNRAVGLAKAKDFEEALVRLRRAVALTGEARRILGHDHAYDSKLDATQESLRQAVAAVEGQAADMIARLTGVVTESDSLLSALDSDERAAEVVAK